MGELSDFSDSFSGKSAEKKQSHGYRRALQSNYRLEGELFNLSNFIKSLGQQQLLGADQSFGKAFDALKRSAGAGRTAIDSQARQQGGAATQGLMSSGFYNSSMAPRTAGAIAGQTGTNMANLEAALGQATGQLEIQKGAQKAGFLTQQQAAQMQLYQFLESLLNQRAQYNIGKGGVAKGGWGEYIGGALPGLAQAAILA